MRRAALLLLVGLNLVLLALFAAQTNPAHAHPADNYIRTWPINSTEDYYFDDDVPNGWRDHVQFGLDQWSNRVNGRAPNFVRSGEVNRVLDYAHFCAGPHSYVYARGDWQATFGGLAGTVLCESPPAKFVMVFEETPPAAHGSQELRIRRTTAGTFDRLPRTSRVTRRDST